MSARIWRIALPSLLIAAVLFSSDSARVSPFEPRSVWTSPMIENSAIKGPERTDPAELLDDPEVAALFADLFRLAGMGTRDLERAAFLVREPDDTWSCLLWPSNAGFRSEQFRGAVPEGVVAIVHTHPNRIVQASAQDVRTAVATGLPVFTITWANITVIDERTGEQQWVSKSRDWRKAVPASLREDCRCREIGPDAKPLREGLLASGRQ